MGTQVQKKMLTIKEAAIYLGIGADNVRKRVRSGQLPVYKMGKLYLLPVSSLDKHIEANTRNTTETSSDIPNE